MGSAIAEQASYGSGRIRTRMLKKLLVSQNSHNSLAGVSKYDGNLFILVELINDLDMHSYVLIEYVENEIELNH